MAKGIDWSKTYKIKVATLLDVFLQGEKGWLRAGCILALCLAIPFWILWRAFFGVLPPGADRGVIVSLFLSYAFLLKPLGTKTWRDKQHPFYAYIDVVCIILALAVGAYKLWGDYFDTRTLTMSIFSSQVQVDLLPGIAAIILVLEATRRMTDWWLVITPVFFIFYAIFSDYLPGIWGGPAVPWQHLINLLFIETEGIYGVGTQVITTTIFLFMFFGTIMMEAKAGNFLIAFGNAAVGRYRGGTAKMAVVSSAFMGTMTGSPAANVAICGTFTIPMMKETGYPPIYAAAVETVASNGGAIMPPVMASMAFLMAAYLGVPYSKIIVYAAVPAVLYYLSLFWAVDLKAKSLGLKGLPRENLPSMRRVLWEGGYLLIPVCLMIYLLLAEYSVSMVGFCSVVAMFILTFARRQTRFNARGVLSTLEATMRNSGGVAIAVISTGLVIGPIASSGLGMRLSNLVLQLSGGSQTVILCLAGIVTFILGLAMTPIIIYIIMLTFIIPAMIKVGIPPVAAHLFIIYWAITESLTPPVCIAAFAAAAIAGSPPMRTGWVATRLGLVTYLLPFAFCFNPSLLLGLQGTWSDFAVAAASAVVGTLLLAIGTERFFLRKNYTYETVLAVIGGTMAYCPTLTLKIGGLVIFTLLIVHQKVRKGRVQEVAYAE
jgi:TRAP transporter 4TM/12TM fusion protein